MKHQKDPACPFPILSNLATRSFHQTSIVQMPTNYTQYEQRESHAYRLDDQRRAQNKSPTSDFAECV